MNFGYLFPLYLPSGLYAFSTGMKPQYMGRHSLVMECHGNLGSEAWTNYGSLAPKISVHMCTIAFYYITCMVFVDTSVDRLMVCLHLSSGYCEQCHREHF